MEDVIFAGTRDRKALGMAEVSLTLIDPDAYGEGPLATELQPNEVALDSDSDGIVGANGDGIVAANGDWDEDAHRQARSAETEEIIAEAQPGTVIEGEEGEVVPSGETEASAQESAPQNGSVAVAAPNTVVLKIRRRKFQRTPARAGEIIVTRRLFRSGDSEYLLNGKLCRLRDIQDIFMGTGLGPESYAIIEQERIGQLLSSKPHDRRAIIEEAAGITRFKTKKRLAELRLEVAKQNLARVNDIFEEVTRQMNSLKRQAAKAERYAPLRDELRTRLRVVLASRIASDGRDQRHAAASRSPRSTRRSMRTPRTWSRSTRSTQPAVARGYELDASAKEASTRANQSAIELERASARQHANEERIAELDRPLRRRHRRARAGAPAAGTASPAEREQHRSFLETAAAEAARFREQAEALQQQAREAAQTVAACRAATRSRTSPRHATSHAKPANARNQTAQAEEALAALEREAERLAGEIGTPHAASLRPSAPSAARHPSNSNPSPRRLNRLEREIRQSALRDRADPRRRDRDCAAVAMQLRAEHATLTGRRNSLEGLIREHSYSTDTVRKLFRTNGHTAGLSRRGHARRLPRSRRPIRKRRRRVPPRRAQLHRRQELGCRRRRHAPAQDRRRRSRHLPRPSPRRAGEVLFRIPPSPPARRPAAKVSCA